MWIIPHRRNRKIRGVRIAQRIRDNVQTYRVRRRCVCTAQLVCVMRARALARFFSKSISDGGGGTQTRRARHPQRGKKKKKNCFKK